MATPPEPLRLFEPDPGVSSLSRRETPSLRCDIETLGPLSRTETTSPNNEVDDQIGKAIEAVQDAGDDVVRCRNALADSILAARSLGVTWRAISSAAGVPHQTLHRQFRRVVLQRGLSVRTAPGDRAGSREMSAPNCDAPATAGWGK